MIMCFLIILEIGELSIQLDEKKQSKINFEYLENKIFSPADGIARLLNNSQIVCRKNH
jgi:hypothetical protein